MHNVVWELLILHLRCLRVTSINAVTPARCRLLTTENDLKFLSLWCQLDLSLNWEVSDVFYLKYLSSGPSRCTF